MTVLRRLRHLLLLLVCAALTFGGSFTCFASSGDHDHDDDFPSTRPD